MKNKITKTFQAWLGVSLLLLLLCAAPIDVSAFDWGYPGQDELPSQSYYDNHIGSSSGYNGGMSRGLVDELQDDLIGGGGGGSGIHNDFASNFVDDDDEDPFKPGGGKDNDNVYNDSPIGGGMILLVLLLAFYTFRKGWKFRKQVQNK